MKVTAIAPAIVTRQAMRYVPNTYGHYRYLNEDELVQGTTAMMVDIDTVTNFDDARYMHTVVTIDADPLFDNHGTPSVYFHNTRPYWEGQCLTPIKAFTTGFADRDDFPCPGPRHEF